MDADDTPQKPNLELVRSSSQDGAGGTAGIVLGILEPAKGERADLAAIYAAYRGECERVGCQALPAVLFSPEMAKVCQSRGIEAEKDGDLIYLRDVRLADASAGDPKRLLEGAGA